MYQIEDIVRSMHCDFERIKTTLIQSVLPNPSFQHQYERWYEDICKELSVLAKHKRDIFMNWKKYLPS